MTVRYEHDVLFGKLANIDDEVGKVRRADAARGRLEDWEADDLCVLHLQRAIQAVLDIANHLIAANGYGIAKNSYHAFEILVERGVLRSKLLPTLKAMMGFRNLAVHRYAVLDPDVVRRIVADNLDDFHEFTAEVVAATHMESDAEE